MKTGLIRLQEDAYNKGYIECLQAVITGLESCFSDYVEDTIADLKQFITKLEREEYLRGIRGVYLKNPN